MAQGRQLGPAGGGSGGCRAGRALRAERTLAMPTIRNCLALCRQDRLTKVSAQSIVLIAIFEDGGLERGL